MLPQKLMVSFNKESFESNVKITFIIRKVLENWENFTEIQYV